MRPVETRSERPRAGVGFLGGAASPLPISYWLWGSAVSSPSKLLQLGPGRSPRKFGFWSILGPQKSRQNRQIAFESGGQQVNLGACAPAPLPAPT